MLCSVCVRRHVWGSRRPMCFARTRQNNSTHISCLFVCFLLSLTMHRCWYICVVLVCSVYRDFCANKFDPLEFIRFAADAWMFGVNCVKSTKGRCYSEAIRMAANPHDDVSFFFLYVCLYWPRGKRTESIQCLPLRAWPKKPKTIIIAPWPPCSHRDICTHHCLSAIQRSFITNNCYYEWVAYHRQPSSMPPPIAYCECESYAKGMRKHTI